MFKWFGAWGWGDWSLGVLGDWSVGSRMVSGLGSWGTANDELRISNFELGLGIGAWDLGLTPWGLGERRTTNSKGIENPTISFRLCALSVLGVRHLDFTHSYASPET